MQIRGQKNIIKLQESIRESRNGKISLGTYSYETGRYYEEKAAIWLENHGFCILERNFRCRFGEIDVIARESGYLVFAEVKYRSDNRRGSAQESVTFRKQRCISDTAAYYMKTHRIGSESLCRFDVICTDGVHITLYRNAFDYCGRFR